MKRTPSNPTISELGQPNRHRTPPPTPPMSVQTMDRIRCNSLMSCRADLANVQRVVVKAGTSVVSNPNGSPSLTRIASIVEQVAQLMAAGKEVLLVSSGAVGCGRKRLGKASIMSSSMREMMAPPVKTSLRGSPGGNLGEARQRRQYEGACAAAGQAVLMGL